MTYFLINSFVLNFLEELRPAVHINVHAYMCTCSSHFIYEVCVIFFYLMSHLKRCPPIVLAYTSRGLPHRSVQDQEIYS